MKPAFFLGMLAGLLVAGILHQKPSLPQLIRDSRKTSTGEWIH